MLNSKQYFDELESVFLFPQDCLSDDGVILLYEMFNSMQSMNEKERTQFIKNFKSNIEEFRLNDNKCPKCPKCSQPLGNITKNDTESLEHFGTPCSQSYTYKRCPECGWRDDK